MGSHLIEMRNLNKLLRSNWGLHGLLSPSGIAVLPVTISGQFMAGKEGNLKQTKKS
jgi:hypothetical protein